MKKWLALLLCVSMLALFCGCSGQAEDTMPTENTTVESTVGISATVGLSLPNQTDPRWTALKAALEAKNYQVLLEDANGDVPAQAEQIGKLIDQKVECLVIVAVDSAALSQSIAQAKKAGIPVVAYDRMLVNAEGVTGYVAFDHFQQGLDMAQKIADVKALETAKAEKRSYTVEFLMDTYQNHSNVLYYQGLMQGLQGYLEAGVLVCPSGRVNFEDVCVQDVDLAKAQSLCEKLLSDHYKEGGPDILITGNDVISGGCVAAFHAKGCPAESWPLIAGKNATAEGVARVVAGKQIATTYEDSTALEQAAVGAVEAVLAGKPAGEQTQTNGTAEVPAHLLKPELITVDNYEALLIDTGIFTREQMVEN